jgi:predicted dithiol-disulfide oxidoreductase (DUF899 family)
MNAHPVVSNSEWTRARKELLAKEKEFSRAREALAESRRALPWERVEKTYVFDGPDGQETLAELFAGRSQLVVYHFMFGPDAEAGCKSCSFWADNFERSVLHLAHNDVTMIAISRGPLPKLEAYKKRLGWSFKWVSSGRTDFNFDYGVSFEPNDKDALYNYAPRKYGSTELPGISVFLQDGAGAVFHTYSAFARGIDMMNATYQYLDLVPRGRNENGSIQAWVRRNDEYDAAR